MERSGKLKFWMDFKKNERLTIDPIHGCVLLKYKGARAESDIQSEISLERKFKILHVLQRLGGDLDFRPRAPIGQKSESLHAATKIGARISLATNEASLGSTKLLMGMPESEDETTG
ncbi:hypothetical protein D0O09_32665 [Pseudomonas putida]|nr:hypothetical protein D0O09_32665 [Pseudomonas putida]